VLKGRIQLALLVWAVGASLLAASGVARAQGSESGEASAAASQVAADDGPGASVGSASGQEPAAAGRVVEAVLFYVFAAAVLFSALGVCICASVVRMATCLFGTLGAVAVLYFLLGANFLGAIQLIVYAGGTLILLVFGVMLTSKSPWVRFEVRPVELVAAGAVAIAFFAGLGAVLTQARWGETSAAAQVHAIKVIGKSLLTTYLVPFEVASVVLLVVMIGAAYMARQEKS